LVQPIVTAETAAGLARLLPGSAEQPTCTLRPEQGTATGRQASSANDATRQDISDEALLLEISYGREWAMEVLYDRYVRYAYALAYRIVRDYSTAEDIVQDVFLSIWRKAASYQEQHGCVRSWLQAIVHHRAIDCVRASAHRDHHSLEDASETGYSNEAHLRLKEEKPEIWEEVWNEERRVLLQNTLAQLPEEQRQVIVLGYFGGYTHAEIAQRWHLPLGTVKGRMRLGLQKMKYLLSQHGINNAG
jgi:RNA polymerase sigma-70 factor (ECF subfamily)